MKIGNVLAGATTSLLVGSATAQQEGGTCMAQPAPRFAPQMAPGYTAKLLMSGLNAPRSLIFDQLGKLLVLEKGVGVRQIELADQPDLGEACAVQSRVLLHKPELNHGLTMTADGKMMFASSVDKVFAFGYDAGAGGQILSDEDAIIDMANGGHTSRTLLASKHQPNWLLVSRGSEGNIDPQALNTSSGHSTIKYFPMDEILHVTANHADGWTLGFGLRNSVAVAEHPITGAIWSMDNSMDDITRLGVDVHNDNPAEELNFHGVFEPGVVNGFNGRNYGYPACVAAWDPSTLANPGLQRGIQFVPNIAAGVNPMEADAVCNQYTAPELVFPPHMAPLDIKFASDGLSAFMAFHGSWDRSPPQGYNVARLDFGPDGMPANTPDRAKIIMANPDNTLCPGGCFRPTGLAFDSRGRLFMCSDATGEIYVIEGPPPQAPGNSAA